ncbi:hypothetical protein [Cellulomonas taurus]|uniref:hypothetical protein n=1 Tax=Cellulomonas taurus TaxID=2729175 RepID=UPI00145FA625|nr:hypothetical protein [Cellulomonas taurus]
MSHSTTWRGLAVAVAAALAFGVAPLAAGADEPAPADDAQWSAPAVVDAPATEEGSFSAQSELQATAAASPNAVWDLFRVMNSRRIDQGGSPWVLNPTLTTVANNWLAQKGANAYPMPDPNVATKVPGSYTQIWHNTAWSIATSPEQAVQLLAEQLATADLTWAPTTDIGIGMVQEPYVEGYSFFSFYIVATDYPHSVAQAGEMTLYRFYRPNTGTHFYSTSAAERNSVAKSSSYRYEGQVAYVLSPSAPSANTANLNRFYQPASGTHFYTSSVAEYNRVLTFPQYGLDGVAGKVYTGQVNSGITPMYRFFRPASGTHFYTANPSEVQSVKNIPGYTYEGVAFFLRTAY